jgi:hypothetical protein
MMRKRVYRESYLREVYDALVALWLEGPKPGERRYLWLENGLERTGSSDRSAFWRGFHGKPDVVVRNSAKQAARAAGQDCARARRADERARRAGR